MARIKIGTKQTAAYEKTKNLDETRRQRSRSRSRQIHYPDDLYWQCLRCHSCCGDTLEHSRHIRLLDREVRIIAYVTARDPKSFCTRITGFGFYEFEMLKQSTGDCIFLSRNICTIYEIRPLTCRFYPFFLEEPVQGGYRFGLTNEKCPGLGQGQLLNEEFFKDLLNTARKKIPST